MADLLFSACYRRAFYARFAGELPTEEEDRIYCQRLATALVNGLNPEEGKG
jgi:hypothetical protein